MPAIHAWPGASSRTLDRLGIASTEVSLILLTHGHLDHLGGARRSRSGSGRPWHSTRPTLRSPGPVATGHFARPGIAGRLFVPFAPRTAPAFEPDIVHDGDLDLAPYGVAGHTIHTPGHTAGSVSVVLEDALLAGDVVAGGFLRGPRRACPTSRTTSTRSAAA